MKKIIPSIIIVGIVNEIINLAYIVYVSEFENNNISRDDLNWMLIVMTCVLFLFLLFGSQLIKGILIEKYKVKTDIIEKKRIISSFLTKSREKLNDLGESQLVMTIEKTYAYCELMTQYNILFISIIMLAFSCVFIALYISVWYLVGVTLLIAFMFFSMAMASPLEKKQQNINEKQQRNIKLITNMLGNICIIKNYYMEKAMKRRFRKSVEEYSKSKLKERDYSLYIYIYMQIVRCAIMVAIPAFTAFLVSKNVAREGDVVIATYGFFYILNHIMICLGSFETLGRLRGDVQYISDVNNIVNEFVCEKIVYPKQMIEYKGVRCSYGCQSVLESEQIAIIPNKLNIIVGESGMGKTTLLKCITGNKSFDGGELLLDNKVTELGLLGKLTTYAPQYPVIFEMSPYENILLGNCNATISDAKKLVKEIAPNLIETFNVCQNAKKLSGGQKQLVSVLRCLISNREIVVLDEPTASLNSEISENLIKLIEKMADRKTFVIATHDKHFFGKNYNVLHL